MRIVCISDTHGFHDKVKVPHGDYLIHAGDISMKGDPYEIRRFAEWFGEQPHNYKVFIAGNHDFGFDKPTTKKDYIGTILAFSQNWQETIYLEDSGVELGGLRFWGSPWTPRFYDWAFMKERGEEIKKVWDKIPDNIDVLVTHGPPYNVLDLTTRGDRAGDEELRNWYLLHPQNNPRLHVFGHIHEGYGKKDTTILPTIFVNASSVDQNYRPINRPIIIDL